MNSRRDPRGWIPPAPLGWLIALVPLAGIVRAIAGTPLVIVLPSVLPALVVAVSLAWFPRRVRLCPPATAFAVVWGAGAAALGAGRVNDLLLAGTGQHVAVVPIFGAPLVEEAAKAAVLGALVLIWHDQVRTVRAGIVAGGLVGLGFAVMENVGYLTLAALQGGPAGLLRGVWVRGLIGGSVHAVCTASVGAGVGYARTAPPGRRLLAVATGFGAGVAQHVAWNGLASRMVTDILCNPTVPDGPCQSAPAVLGLVLTIPLVALATLGPGILALRAIARLSLD